MKGAVAATLVIGLSTPVSAAPFMVVGNDEKAMWDDEGKLTLSGLGSSGQTVTVIPGDVKNLDYSLIKQTTLP